VKVFLLAAGEGTRLWPITELYPKALVPVAGIPCVRRVIDRIRRQGFSDIAVIANERFVPHFRHELRDLDVEILPSPEPQGTAGELLLHRDRIGGRFLVHYADELTGVDLRELLLFHESKANGIGTLALVRNVPLEVGVVELRGERVVGFREKPPLDRPTWAGIAVLEPEILEFINPKEDFARDVFPRVIGAGGRLYGFISDAEWLDIGSLSHLKRAEGVFSRSEA